ncbi:MAG: transglutaminase-like cysteine peptidase [Mycobacteriales bacterium]
MRASIATAAIVCAIGAGFVGTVHAQPLGPRFMKLGRAAPAPPGFLAFCARMPDQCGLAQPGRQGAGAAVGDDRLERQLYSKYYWPALFAPGGAALAPPAPRSDLRASRPNPDLQHASAMEHGAGTPTDIHPLTTDQALMSELASVNGRVNRAIRYVSDRALYGDENHWHLALGPGAPGAGDCKDYVLEKRRALVEDGIDPSELSIAIVETSWRESHAVLLVSTDAGELVMDSLSDDIQPWWRVRYDWIERQAPGRQLEWVSITRDGQT